jgi:hypothetical protein
MQDVLREVRTRALEGNTVE